MSHPEKYHRLYLVLLDKMEFYYLFYEIYSPIENDVSITVRSKTPDIGRKIESWLVQPALKIHEYFSLTLRIRLWFSEGGPQRPVFKISFFTQPAVKSFSDLTATNRKISLPFKYLKCSAWGVICRFKVRTSFDPFRSQGSFRTDFVDARTPLNFFFRTVKRPQSGHSTTASTRAPTVSLYIRRVGCGSRFFQKP